MAGQPGQLTVKLNYASNLKDVQFLGKQDPYCRVCVSGQTLKSSVHKNGGRNPVWNETYKFHLAPGDTLATVEVWDANVGQDELIGTADVDLTTVRMAKTASVSVPVHRPRSGKARGTLSLDLWFEPTTSPEPYKGGGGGGGVAAAPAGSSNPPHPLAGAVPASAAAAALAAGPNKPPTHSTPPAPPGTAAAMPPPPPATGTPVPHPSHLSSQQQGPPPYAYPHHAYPPAPQQYSPNGYPGQQAPYGYPPPAGGPQHGYPPAPPPGYPTAGPPPGYPTAAGGGPYPPPYHGTANVGPYRPPYGKPPRPYGGGMGMGGGMAMGALGGLAAGMLMGEAMDDVFDGGDGDFGF